MHTIDLGIIIGYLLLTLVVGLYQGRKVKSMKDYAIADRNYATPIMVATISATLIGGGSTLGVVEKITTVGLLYLVIFLGDPVSKILIARFVAPRMAPFRDMMSIGDIMESFYGKGGKILTGLSGSLITTGWLGAQISALGVIFHFFFDVSHFLGALIGFGIVIAYSTFGGIRAVTLTDVIQFGILLVAIPMLCNVGLNEIGGYGDLFRAVPDKYLSLDPQDQSIWQYLSLVFIFCIPFLTPAVMQRLLLARDTQQIQKSFTVAALLDVPLYTTIGVIALIVVAMKPDIEPALAMPYLVSHILPIGLKGFVVAGVIAVIMSTCDSYLNAASLSVVHDTLKPLFPQMKSRTELKLTKFVTFFLGGLSMIVAVKYKVIMDIVVGSLNVWGPVIVVPLYFGIFKGKSHPSCFFAAATAGIVTNLSWGYASLDTLLEIGGLLPSMIANGATFWFWRTFVTGGERASVPVPLKKKTKATAPFFDLYLLCAKARSHRVLLGPKNFLNTLLNRLEEYQPPYVLFGIFAMINYIFPYFMWGYTEDFYTTTLLRFVAGGLAFGLIMKDYWAASLKKYVRLYWGVTLLYCLPFLTTYMLQENQGAYNWVLNSSLALLLLSALVDWRSFLTLVGFGVPLGIGVYTLLHGPVSMNLDKETLFWAFYMCFFSVVIGLTFSRKKEALVKERQRTLKAAAGTIAHEMRTPLATISLDGGFVSDVACALEKFGKTFTGKEREAFDAEIGDLKDLAQSLSRTSRESQNVVTLLLTNLQQDFTHLPCEKLSMKEVLDHALETFVFKGDGRSKVHVEVEQDFTVKGNRDLLTHVFFNLLKNSLYFIQAAGKGEIFITLKGDADHHTVIFKDTGPGIKKEVLPKVLTAFYSQRLHGTGIGLAFCQRVMESMKGRIRVDSTFGEHTTFTLTFPSDKIDG